MERIYIKSIKVEKVRHIVNENICLDESPRHLILTGKNGSGKTSLLEAISDHLISATTSDILAEYPKEIEFWQRQYEDVLQNGNDQDDIAKKEKNLIEIKSDYDLARCGLDIDFNVSYASVKRAFESGNLVLAYYRDERSLFINIPKHVEKIELEDSYSISDNPSTLFVKYLLDMKMTEALAAKAGKDGKADNITKWFEKFEKVLQEIYMDDSVRLDFDEETFAFRILQEGREPFGFNELSRGFAAILNIVVDLMIRMEKHTKRKFCFDIPGIVLIDEIETHLHLELQKRIMGCLTKLFPNIQFVVSTHSPFVLNSIDNVIIYDLANKTRIDNGLSDIPYDGIVEGYFNVDKLSEDLRTKFEEYKRLTGKEHLSNDDFSRIAELEVYLSEIPDYLALDITTEYERLKLAFDRRKDIG